MTSHDKLPNRILMVQLALGDGIRAQWHVLTPWELAERRSRQLLEKILGELVISRQISLCLA